MAFMIRSAALSDIPIIRSMAAHAWIPTYVPILGREQVDYMLSLFYTPQNLETQMTIEGQEFFLCHDGEVPVVFAAVSPIGSGSFKLHKLYVIPECQGKGAGRYVLNHLVSLLRERGITELTLNVNRYNHNAIRFYEAYGFTRIREEDIDIGSGYFMNDFVYALPILR